MDFQDVVFLFCAGFSTTFHKNCGRGESLKTTHVSKLWLETWVLGMLLVKCFCFTKPLFVSVKFYGDQKTATRSETYTSV